MQRPFFAHLVVEIFDVDYELANSFLHLNKKLRKVLKLVNIPVIKNCKHEFTPHGLSMVYVLAASHLAVHTWPELKYLHLDLVTCTPETDFQLFVEDLRKFFAGSKIVDKELTY